MMGSYLIQKFGFTAAEAIALMCIVGPQQQYMYLKQLEWAKQAIVDETKMLAEILGMRQVFDMVRLVTMVSWSEGARDLRDRFPSKLRFSTRKRPKTPRDVQPRSIPIANYGGGAVWSCMILTGCIWNCCCSSKDLPGNHCRDNRPNPSSSTQPSQRSRLGKGTTDAEAVTEG